MITDEPNLYLRWPLAERAMIRDFNSGHSSAAVSDSAVRLRMRRTYGRRGYPGFPSDGCVRDDLYLSFIYFLVPIAGQFHVKPTTTQQFYLDYPTLF